MNVIRRDYTTGINRSDRRVLVGIIPYFRVRSLRKCPAYSLRAAPSSSIHGLPVRVIQGQPLPSPSTAFVSSPTSAPRRTRVARIAPSARVVSPTAPDVGNIITGKCPCDTTGAVQFLAGTLTVLKVCTSIPDPKVGVRSLDFVSQLPLRCVACAATVGDVARHSSARREALTIRKAIVPV